jgi:hypothetical protein
MRLYSVYKRCSALQMVWYSAVVQRPTYTIFRRYYDIQQMLRNLLIYRYNVRKLKWNLADVQQYTVQYLMLYN